MKKLLGLMLAMLLYMGVSMGETVYTSPKTPHTPVNPNLPFVMPDDDAVPLDQVYLERILTADDTEIERTV